jgi:V-type H+-transporting ATPase proteolipid subunit
VSSHLEFVLRILLGTFLLVSCFLRFSIIFCEANAIYGIIIAVILINKVSSSGYDIHGDPIPGFDYATLYYAAYAIFSAGVSVGLSNVTSGYKLYWTLVTCSLSVGICGSSCALSDAQNGELFAKMLISQIFASALGIYGIIVGIIVSNLGQFPK